MADALQSLARQSHPLDSVSAPPEALPAVLAGPRPPRQNRRVPTLAPHPFRFRDPLTGKWVCARHKDAGAGDATLLHRLGDNRRA
jgi:hypothetical protein